MSTPTEVRLRAELRDAHQRIAGLEDRLEALQAANEALYKAGYDPRALISFLERLNLVENQNPGAVSRAFSTHPPTGDRIRKMLQEIEHLLPARAAYVVSTSDFDELRSRLVSRTSKHSNSTPDPHRPTLRRRDTREGNEFTPSDAGPGPDRPGPASR